MCTTSVAAIFALQAYLPDHVINFLGGRDGVNTLGNLTSSVKIFLQVLIEILDTATELERTD